MGFCNWKVCLLGLYLDVSRELSPYFLAPLLSIQVFLNGGKEGLWGLWPCLVLTACDPSGRESLSWVLQKQARLIFLAWGHTSTPEPLWPRKLSSGFALVFIPCRSLWLEGRFLPPPAPKSHGLISITTDGNMGGFPRERVLSKRMSTTCKGGVHFLLIPNVRIHCLRKGGSELARMAVRSERVGDPLRVSKWTSQLLSCFSRRAHTPHCSAVQRGLVHEEETKVFSVSFGVGLQGQCCLAGGILPLCTPLAIQKGGTSQSAMVEDTHFWCLNGSSTTFWLHCALITSPRWHLKILWPGGWLAGYAPEGGGEL